MRFSLFLAISAIWLAACLEAVNSNPVPIPDENESSSLTSEGETKPRCLQTLFGYYAKKKVVGALDSFTPDIGPQIPDFPSPPGSLQGGILSGPSQSTPGLPSHALDAVQNAQLMNSQLSLMNSQLHPQFGGAGTGSNIPMSPIQFRHGMESFSTGIHEGFPTVVLQQPMMHYL